MRGGRWNERPAGHWRMTWTGPTLAVAGALFSREEAAAKRDEMLADIQIARADGRR